MNCTYVCTWIVVWFLYKNLLFVTGVVFDCIYRLSNYTLGLGLNRVPLVVVDLMHSEPWTVNTYTLNIYRLRPGFQEQDFDASQPHQVCYLEQVTTASTDRIVNLDLLKGSISTSPLKSGR